MRTKEILFRWNEILLYGHEIQLRGNQMLFREKEMLLRGNEMLLHENEMLLLFWGNVYPFTMPGPPGELMTREKIISSELHQKSPTYGYVAKFPSVKRLRRWKCANGKPYFM